MSLIFHLLRIINKNYFIFYLILFIIKGYFEIMNKTEHNGSYRVNSVGFNNII